MNCRIRIVAIPVCLLVGLWIPLVAVGASGIGGPGQVVADSALGPAKGARGAFSPTHSENLKLVGGRRYGLTFDEEFDHRMKFPNRKFLTYYKRWGNLRTLVGNGEKEIYVDRSYVLPSGKTCHVNPFDVLGGSLRIQAMVAPPYVEKATGYSYVSGMITTEQSFAQLYGYFEVRARMPKGAGLWPAIWLVGKTYKQHLEIDIMEALGRQRGKVHIAIAGSGASRWINGIDSTDGFHTYAVAWGKEWVIWYLDGREVDRTRTPPRFKVPMYLIVNLAVGGHWGGDPDAKTKFPASMLVDYIRIYRRIS